MRAVIQRVSHASVTIEGVRKSEIGQGYLILLGICDEDATEDVDWLVKKIANLRVFDDENGVMNRSILEIGGNCLIVSQFTLYASYKKGKSPELVQGWQPRALYPTLRSLLQTAFRSYREDGRHRRIWGRHEGRAAQRRPCNHLYGHQEQGIK